MIKLVLEKKMNSDNTSGIVNNQAELTKDYNIYGISDVNSKVGNKKQGENDCENKGYYFQRTVKAGTVILKCYIKTDGNNINKK